MTTPRGLAVEVWYREMLRWFLESKVTGDGDRTEIGRRHLPYETNREWIRSRMLHVSESARRSWSVDVVTNCIYADAKRISEA